MGPINKRNKQTKCKTKAKQTNSNNKTHRHQSFHMNYNNKLEYCIKIPPSNKTNKNKLTSKEMFHVNYKKNYRNVVWTFLNSWIKKHLLLELYIHDIQSASKYDKRKKQHQSGSLHINLSTFQYKSFADTGVSVIRSFILKRRTGVVLLVHPSPGLQWPVKEQYVTDLVTPHHIFNTNSYL